MKKILVVFVALLTMAVFGRVVTAQAPANPVDKPAASAATDKPAAAAAEKPKAQPPKAEKKEALKAVTISGTVAGYEAGKMIKVKSQDKEMAFDITGATSVKGEIKEGAKVTIMYKKDGEKMVATALTVAAEKKAGEKEPVPAPAEKKG